MSDSEGKSYNDTGAAGAGVDYATDEDLRAARAAKLRAEMEPEGFEAAGPDPADRPSSTRLFDETSEPGFDTGASARGAIGRLVAERPLYLAAGALVLGAMLGRFG
jgi:hypothetical protein